MLKCDSICIISTFYEHGRAMKFLYGHPPEPAMQLAGAEPLKLPSLNTVQGVAFGIGVLMLALLAAALWVCSQLQPFLDALTHALDVQPPLVFLLVLPLTLFVHEVVHCLAFPRPDKSVIGILPKTALAFAWNGEPIPRFRMLVAILAPLVGMSAILFALYLWVPAIGGHALPAMLFNVLGSGGDVLVLVYTLRQVPSDGWFQMIGKTMWWGRHVQPPT